MPIPGLDPNLCARRNRVAALRDGAEAGALRFFREGETLTGATTVELAVSGKLPKDDAEALAFIYALGGRNADGEALTADDVWIHYAEAANDNFIPDRYMHLAPSTLQNIARDAAKGVAFMNSHRTGSMSTPSELPFGKTFAGRFEEYRADDGKKKCRALIGVYFLRGVKPNGENGPSTDDLHAGINAGTIADVSVGLYDGSPKCDVCGLDLPSWYGDGEDEECAHVPGTTRGMTPKDCQKQAARGVTGGRASYSLHDASMGEVSAVYDGAVPGAGFRLAVSLARHRQLDANTLSECQHAYVRLARGDFASTRCDSGDLRQPGAPDVTNYTAANLAPQVPSSEITDTQVSDSARDAESFEAQLDATLAAVSRCLDRGERLRRVSGGRYAQLQALQQRGSELLQTLQPERDQSALRALRLRDLRRRAQMLPTVGD